MVRWGVVPSLWLSSSEHHLWNRHRRVEVVRLLDAPATPDRYAVLHVGEDQRDGPMLLVAAGRFDLPWAEPHPGATVHLSVWRLDDAAEDEARGVYRRYPDR